MFRPRQSSIVLAWMVITVLAATLSGCGSDDTQAPWTPNPTDEAPPLAPTGLGARVAAADKFPTPQLRANYQYWNTEHSVTTAIEVPLPVFVRGQGEEARARARANGLLDEAAAREQSLRAEVLAVLELARTLAQSRQQYATTGAAELRSLVEDAQRNYGERRIDMLTLLNVQRQALQAARDALDLSVREALARLWLDAAMWVLR